MSNKMKKLICSLLASAMLLGSVGVVSFADETTTTAADTEATETATEATAAPDAEATEAPAEEATEAPAEATEAPAETTEAPATEAPVVTTTESTAYDSDSYYQKALALCSSLGIISGYEDGSVKPESNVTRAEMASIVLRMLAMKDGGVYNNIFTDVDSSHWAASQIQTAYEAKIVSGMGDGTFAPDGQVTYAQVMVMLVNAMNHKDDAEYYGGWQQGYIKEAGELKLLKNAPGSADVPSERGVVIKMVYNALLGEYNEIRTYDQYGNPKYNSDKTLAEVKFDVIEAKGTLLGTSKTSTSGNNLQENQVEIEYTDDDGVTRKEVFDCNLKGLENLLAQKVKFYYKENAGLTPEVVAVVEDNTKSDTYTVDAEDIEKVEGFEDGEGTIKVEKVSKVKNCAGAKIIYNGKQYEAADNDTGLTLDELLIPDKGTLKLVDSDDDDVYETVFVDAYEVMIVTAAGTDRLTGKVSAATADDISATRAMSLNLDDSEDRTITVSIDGGEAKLRNLKKDNVATIKRSLDNTVVDIVVTGESVTGSATAITKKLDESHCKVNGTTYDVANIAVGDLKSGTESTFYLDMFGRIARIEAAAASGQLQSGEKYGWIMNAYYSESGEDFLVQMMTMDGKEIEMKLADNVDYWGPKEAASTTLKGDNAKTTIENLIKQDSNFVTVSSIGTPIRLVKYKANSSNNISRLYCAVDSKAVSNDNALRIDPTNFNGKPVAGGLVGGYSITDGILEVSVPKSSIDMKDASNYKFGEVNAQTYVVRENGSSRDYVVGEFTSSTTPTLLINFTASADALASIGDIDTNGNNPVMVIDEIDSGIDEDDNVVYTLKGYVGGTEASVTTTKNTVLGIIDAKSALINDARDYSVQTNMFDINGDGQLKAKDDTCNWTWDAKHGDISGNDQAFTDILSEGDLVLYDTGERLIKLLDADEVYQAVTSENKNLAKTNGWLFGAFQPFPARNMFIFGGLKESELDDVSWVALDDFGIAASTAKGASAISASNLNTISFDSAKLMDTIEININSGKASIDTEGSEISDLVNFDAETKTGDYIFARYADKGTLQEMVVYRFVK